MIPNRMGGGRYGLHERYSEEERQHYQHFADHQSHEAVSTVKLRKTRRQAEESKPYFETMYEAMTSILSRSVSWSISIQDLGKTGKRR